MKIKFSSIYYSWILENCETIKWRSKNSLYSMAFHPIFVSWSKYSQWKFQNEWITNGNRFGILPLEHSVSHINLKYFEIILIQRWLEACIHSFFEYTCEHGFGQQNSSRQKHFHHWRILHRLVGSYSATNANFFGIPSLRLFASEYSKTWNGEGEILLNVWE